MPKSFRAALAAYGADPNLDGAPPNLTREDRAHLKRWADDDRADEVWNTINCACSLREFSEVIKASDELIEWFFIQDILEQRRLAESVVNRWKHRALFRRYAAQMQKTANILREAPDGHQIIPSSEELALMLEDAAEQYRDYIAASQNVPGEIRWTRKSKPSDIFISTLSNTLSGFAGRWLDYEVAVLTQIAFDNPDIDNEQVIWIRRGVERGRASPKAAD